MVDRWLHAYSGTAHIASPSAHSSSPPISAAILPPPLPPSVPNLSADPGSPHASTVTASLGGEKRGDSKVDESGARMETGRGGEGNEGGGERAGGSDEKAMGAAGKGAGGETGMDASQAADQVRAYRRHVEQMQESEKLLYAEIDELRAALSAEREVARATERVAEAECWRRLEVERGRAALAREVERLQEELADALEQADGGGEEGGDAGGRGREERLSEVERQAREEVAELEEQMEQVCASAAQREQQFRALLREMEEELGAAQAMAMVAMEREERANDALHTLRQVNDQLMQRLLQQGKVLRAHRPPADHGKQHTDGAEGEAADDDGGVTRGEHERVKDEGACAEGGGGKGLGTGGCGEDSSEGVKAAVDARQERCEERCEESAGREVTADVDVSPPRCAEEFAVPPLHPCASPQSSRGKAVGGGQGKTRASSCDTSSAGSSGSAGSMTGLCSGCRQKMIRARVGAAGRSSTPSSTSSGSRASTGESSPGRRQTEQEEEARRGWRERGSDAQPRVRAVAGGEREAWSDDETASEFSFHFRGALSDSGELAGLYGPAVVGCRPRTRAWGGGDRARHAQGGAGGSRQGDGGRTDSRSRRRWRGVREGEEGEEGEEVEEGEEGEESLSSVSGGGDDACTRMTWQGLLGAGRQAEEERGEGGMCGRGRERGAAWVAAELGELVGEAERVWEWAEEKECVEQGMVQLCVGLKLLLLKLLHGGHAGALPRTGKRKRREEGDGQAGEEASDDERELLQLLAAGEAEDEEEEDAEEGEGVVREGDKGGVGGGQWLCLEERGADSRWVRVTRSGGRSVEGKGRGEGGTHSKQGGVWLEDCCSSPGEDARQGGGVMHDGAREGHERCVYETRMGDSSEEGDGVQQGGNSAVQSGSSSGRGEQGKEGEAAERGSEGAASADDAMEGGSGSCCSRQGESMDGMIASDSVDRDDDVASTGDSGGQETKEGEASGGEQGGLGLDGGEERSKAIDQMAEAVSLIPATTSDSDGAAADAPPGVPLLRGANRNGSRSVSGRGGGASGGEQGGACDVSEHMQGGSKAEAHGSGRKHLSVLPLSRPMCALPMAVPSSPAKLGKWVVGGVWKGVVGAAGQRVAGEQVGEELEWCRASLQALTEAVYMQMAAVLEQGALHANNGGGGEGGGAMDEGMVEGVLDKSHGQVQEAEALLGKAQRTLQRLAAVQGRGRALCRRISSKQRVLLELQRCLLQARGHTQPRAAVCEKKDEPHLRCNMFWRR